MMREVRCSMRECRRRIDLDALPARAYAERDACIHFIAAWSGRRGAIIEEVMAGLEDNREFVIRNIRPAELSHAGPSTGLRTGLEAARVEIEAAIARYAHVVPAEGAEPPAGALFGDEFERDGLARALARLILGLDPIAGQQIARGAP